MSHLLWECRSRTLLLLTCLLNIVCAGCAGPAIQARMQPTAVPKDDAHQEEIRQIQRVLEEVERELDGSFVNVMSSQCKHACALSDKICELAGRLCHLYDRHPDDAQLKAHCAEGKKRCQQCRYKLRERCECTEG